MKSFNISFFFLLILDHIFNSQVTSYKVHTALNSIVFTNIDEEPETVHSEYFFGQCSSRQKTLILHEHLKYDDIKGKLIIRRWMDVTVDTECVYVRANSSYADIVRYHAFKFGMCLCRIAYVHMATKFPYYYYEWYVPVEMMKGIDWDLYFYTTSL